MLQDLRFALRVLWSRPAFTLAATISLALGIGANSAIFSVIDALSLHPLAVPDSSRIVRAFSITDRDRAGRLSYLEYADIRSQAKGLEDVVLIGGRGAFLAKDDARHRVLLNLVSPNFFTALRVQPEAGQVFSEASRGNDAHPVVVLGNAAWKRYFGGDPSIVGKQIRVERATVTSYTVIGVLPASFRDVDPGSDRDLWFPVDCWKQLGSMRELEMRDNRWFRVLARTAPGQTVASANVQMATIANRMAAEHPESNRSRGLTVISDLDVRLREAGDDGLVVIGIVLLVVLISSVNVANLLLSKADVRGKEMAVRLSLGASRTRLVSQLMLESLLLGVFGLVLGGILGWWLISWIPSLLVQPPGFDIPNDIAFNPRVLAFTVAVTFTTSILFGLIPALRFTRPDLVPALKTDSLSAASARHGWPLRNWLVLGEVAVVMTLIVCAGMLVRSFSNTRSADLGFTRKPILSVWLAVGDAKPALYRDLASRFAALPGVRKVAVAVRAPLSLSSNGMFKRVEFPGRPEFAAAPPFEIKYNSVSPEFLETMGTPIVRGRGFDSREESATSGSVIINEKLAQQYFESLDPVGRILVASGKPRTVIGVARNAPINAIGETPEPYLYVPYWANFEEEATFLIATDGDAAALARPAHQVLKQLDSKLDPLGITTMQDLIRYSASRYEMTAELAGGLGVLGLILTAVGLYGVVSYGVSQRMREIGIRMALGASASETRMLILREVAILGVAGVALGLPLALAAGRVLKSMLFGIAPWDVPTIAGATVVLLLVLLVAGFLPTRRATSVAPASVLRAS